MGLKDVIKQLRALLSTAKEEKRMLTAEEQKEFDSLVALGKNYRAVEDLDEEEKEDEEPADEVPADEPKEEPAEGEGEAEQPEQPADEPKDEPKDEDKEEKEDEPKDEDNEEKAEEPADEKKDESEECKRRSQVFIKTSKRNKMEQFSIVGAINSVLSHRSFSDTNAEYIKRGRAQMERAGIGAEGHIVIPVMRGIAAGTEGYGAEAVQTDVHDVVSPLYTNSALANLGATILDDLKGDVQLPVLVAGTAANRTETGAAGAAGTALKKINLRPHRVTAYVDISDRFLIQDSASVNAMIMRDMQQSVRDQIERAIFGAGAADTDNDKPAGLFNGINAESNALTYGDIIDLIAGMEGANVYNGKWLMHPLAKAALSKVGVKGAADTASLGFVFGNGEVLGMPAVTSGNVASKALAYGNWEDLVVGLWGGISIKVDDASQALYGNTRLVVSAYYDAQWRRQTTTTSEGTTTTTLDTVTRKILA